MKDGRLSDLGNKRLRLPDLLVYTPDKRNYAFVEVKGPGDKLSKLQEASFEEVKKHLKKDVYIARLKQA